MAVIEIAVENPSNSNLSFRPAGRVVRGRLDFLKVKEQAARAMVDQYPSGIPGQRIRVDTDNGKAEIVEPLHEDRHADIRDKLTKRGFSLDPPRQEISNAHLPTILFWLVRAVQSGAAKFVAGTLPDKIDGKPRKRFLSPEPDNEERNLRKQELAARLAMMSPQQRKEYERILAESN